MNKIMFSFKIKQTFLSKKIFFFSINLGQFGANFHKILT